MEVGKGEVYNYNGYGDAFRAGGDNVDTVTAIVGEGRAKVVSTVPVGIP